MTLGDGVGDEGDESDQEGNRNEGVPPKFLPIVAPSVEKRLELFLVLLPLRFDFFVVIHCLVLFLGFSNTF